MTGGRFKGWTEKLKTIKHIELILLAAAICIGVLVYLGVCEDRETPQTTPSFSYSGTDSEEKRLEQLLESINGVGDCVVMMTYAQDGSVEGVAVAAQGAGDMKVKLKIIDVVCALIDVDGDKIKVYKTN